MANPDPNTYDDRASVEPTPAVPTPTRVAGRYEILGLLGSGGMGTVYRVRDTALDEIVALKLLKGGTLAAPGVLDRFRQEVRLARKVTHPNVVRTFDLGEDGSSWFLTMEYVDARPLSWRLDGGPMPEDELVRVMIGVCDGVEAAHAVGVLHRDLKPDNVLVGEPAASGAPGRVAITDFGIASQRGSAGGGLAGTPAYMAPEQVEGRDVDGRADIYALGAVMFEMATGRRAFVGDDPWAVARMRLEGPPPDPRDVAPLNEGLAEVITRCMAREPRRRFGTAAEVRRALEGVTIRLREASQTVASTTPAAGASTIAVLPFRTADGDSHLANGLAEEVIDLLSVSRGLKVRPLAAVMRVASGDAEEVGRALGVDAVVTGALRRNGERLVLTARLVSVADGFQVWGLRVECTEGELLVQADAIAAGAAGALAQRVVVPARQASANDVVEQYLRARHEYRLGFESGLLEPARATAERGLALAPRDPGLLAVYALICSRQAFYSTDEHDHLLALGFTAARAAVGLAPHSGEAWLAVGALHFVAHEMPEAARALLRAAKEAPGLARAQDMLGGILLDVGRVDAARTRLEASITLDPIPVFVRADLARACAYQGEWARVEKITSPDPDPLIHVIIGEYRARFAIWSKGRIAPTWISAEDVARTLAKMHSATATVQALVTAASGTLPDELDRAAEDGVRKSHGRLRATIAQFLAEARAAVGRTEGALELVAVSVDAGLYDAQWMDHCPVLDAVRADARFAPLRAIVAERAQRVRDALDSP